MLAFLSQLVDVYFLKHPNYRVSNLSSSCGPPCSLELWSFFGKFLHQSEYHIDIGEFPEGVGALDSAIFVSQNLTARVSATIPRASTMEKSSGLR